MIKLMGLMLFALVFSVGSKTADSGATCGSPPPANAVLDLPSPLSEWATIVCTPYGYIISNHDGWIWSRPAAYSPVFVPAQMVRENPKKIGQAAYFTKINFAGISPTGDAAKKALAVVELGLKPRPASAAYRLSVTGSLGRSLVLYFFKIDGSIWGVWCGKSGDACSPESRFMLLNMRKGG